MIAARASIADPRYGRRYASRRRISRASYAFPRTSSSNEWVPPAGRAAPHALRRLQLFFQQLLPVERGVQAVARDQRVVPAPFGDPPALQHEDLVGVADRRNPVR